MEWLHFLVVFSYLVFTEEFKGLLVSEVRPRVVGARFPFRVELLSIGKSHKSSGWVPRPS